MDVAFLERFVTLYGPLGLGWVVAWLLWRRIIVLNDAGSERGEKTLVALTKITTLLETLPALIRNGGRHGG